MRWASCTERALRTAAAQKTPVGTMGARLAGLLTVGAALDEAGPLGVWVGEDPADAACCVVAAFVAWLGAAGEVAWVPATEATWCWCAPRTPVRATAAAAATAIRPTVISAHTPRRPPP